MKRARLNPFQAAPMQVFQGNPGRVFAHKRPVDKAIIVINKDVIDATASNTVLVTVTFPCTIVGIRWDLSFFADGGSSITSVRWDLLIVKEGNAVGATSSTDGATFHDPEQNVIVHGFTALAPGDGNQNPRIFAGETKSMRKMMGGDQFFFSMTGEATNTVGCRGIVQFFCKT